MRQFGFDELLQRSVERHRACPKGICPVGELLRRIAAGRSERAAPLLALTLVSFALWAITPVKTTKGCPLDS